MIPSPRAREAIKLGLGIMIAYAISLHLGWDRPYWAAFAVAFCALSTTGQSLNKGMMRLAGTLVAAVVALTLIGLFGQLRWAFVAALAAWIGLCTYRMGGTSVPYTWQVAGFVTAIIAGDGGVNPENAFDLTVLRVEETGLGFLVYTVLSVLLWPTSSRAGLQALACDLVETQRGLLRATRPGAPAAQALPERASLGAKASGLLVRLPDMLDAARLDSYEVWQAGREWQAFARIVAEIEEVLDRFGESLADLDRFAPGSVLRNGEAVMDVLDQRLDAAARILGGEELALDTDRLAPDIDRAALTGLSHFERAALMVSSAQLERLDALSAELVTAVRGIRGQPGAAEVAPAMPSAGFSLDPDRLVAAAKMMAIVWVAYLVWIYVEVPGGVGFVVMSVSLGMPIASTPQIRMPQIAWPIAGSVVFAGAIYTLVMPQLWSFYTLGPLIFACTAGIAYVFADPRQGLSKMVGLAIFVSTIGVTNEQQYNFLSMLDTAVMLAIILGMFALMVNFPFSARPEKAFLRLLSRFFRHADYILSRFALDVPPPRGPGARLKAAVHRADLRSLPAKLARWGAMIDHRTFPSSSAEQVAALIPGLHTLATRIRELADARERPQAEAIVRELHEEVRAWRIGLQSALDVWAHDPAAASSKALSERLEARLERVEARVAEAMERVEGEGLGPQDYANCYRLLGDFRGLSEALIAYARLTESMGWSEWRESRF